MIITDDNCKNYKLVACVLRNTGNGWEAINDTGHEPMNVSRIETTDTSVIVHHSFTAKKVVSFLTTNDETFQLAGLRHGASVGFDKSIISMSYEGDKTNRNPKNVISAKGNIWCYGIFLV